MTEGANSRPTLPVMKSPSTGSKIRADGRERVEAIDVHPSHILCCEALVALASVPAGMLCFVHVLN